VNCAFKSENLNTSIVYKVFSKNTNEKITVFKLLILLYFFKELKIKVKLRVGWGRMIA